MSRVSRGKRPAAPSAPSEEDETETGSPPTASDYDTESSIRARPRPRTSLHSNGVKTEPAALPNPSSTVANGTSGAGHDDKFKPGSVLLNRADKNYVIRLRIRRENNAQKFWLDGREVPQKKIQTLVRNLNIQVDNLCQFLPQDRVAAFAGLGEVQLLDEMLRAAAPPKVIQWHQRLKELYKDQAEVQKQVRADSERLDGLHNSQRNMQADVDRVKDREAAQQRLQLLQAALTAAQYTEAAQKFRQAKEDKQRSAARVKELEEENEPSLKAVTDRQRYQNNVAAAVESRKTALHRAERTADELLVDLKLTKKKAVVGEIRRKINQLEAQMKNEPPKFDSSEWNLKIREQEHIARDMQVQMNDFNVKLDNIKREMGEKKVQNERLKQQIEALGTRQGKQLSALRSLDADAAKAYEWLQQNKDKFEKEYSDQIQSLLQKRDLVCFTAQTKSDQAKLSHHFIKEMGLSVSLRLFRGSMDEFRPSVKASDLGFDGFAVDYLEGPSLLLAQFCSTSQLHRAGISLKELSDEQYQRLDAQDYVNSWTAGRLHYKRTHRKEYGDAGKSTVTKDIRPAAFWKDQPVDSGETEELRLRQSELRQQFSELTDQREQLKEKIDGIFQELEGARTKLEQLKEEKGGLQAQYTRWKGIPLKIGEKDNLLFLRGIGAVRAAHKDWVDASVCLIEARSDVAGLQERSRAIIEQCEAERQKLEAAQAVERESKAEARRLKDVILQLQQQFGEEFTQLTVGKTSSDIEDEIAAEEERLGMISDVPQNTLQKYDQIVAALANVEKQLEAGRRKIDVLGSEIGDLRHRWEPHVDELVDKVTEAFGYNFQQIGCAGEVRLHKDEDFEKWALHVMRTVATAFFLLALQGSAQAPFRVVDEINQGMDPRNERMVHNRMLLTGLRYDEGMTVLCVASGTHMPEETEKLHLAECLKLQKQILATAAA
ncbi:unnamed protein product [Parascedosporium putredinis]|uniref:Structural maintenance of chromosomes protein 5 n=1 Tax=Parascedosporium putredinis TaxID=1442378 RepID=A0A9P1GVQ6_9PEZI|nr:unnamed protein product [Parascedosporium putredinis]CAI7988206.1 unnamed protein product [Parascedosporium putredinis]